MLEATPERRAYPVTPTRFWTALALLLTTLGISPFLAARWAFTTVIRDEIRVQLTTHNEDPLAHIRNGQETARASAALAKEQRDGIELKLDKIFLQIQQLQQDVAVIKATTRVERR